jgi:UPF0042 nucleotide-binding protein
VKRALRVVVVTGMAGAGKSTAIHVLEDLGFYCIDNLPVVLVPQVLELCETATEGITRVALGIDLREREFLHGYPAVLDGLRQQGRRVEILFLDAADDVLVRRFGETRRPHPAAADGGTLAGVAREREQIAGLRERADRILDTSTLTIHELRGTLTQWYGRGLPEGTTQLALTSFGYKFGVPADLEMLFDARFLTNPYFVAELRDRDGLDPVVAQFVLDRDETRQFLDRIVGLLEFVLPHYQREGKLALTVGIGCTGGRHRSVVLTQRLAELFGERGVATQVRHRDLGR